MNEFIEDMRLSGINGLICELNLEKAYDHVNWIFWIMSWIGWVLELNGEVGFFIVLHQLNFLLVNGCPIGFIRCLRSLRQGDSLIPSSIYHGVWDFETPRLLYASVMQATPCNLCVPHIREHDLNLHVMWGQFKFYKGWVIL